MGSEPYFQPRMSHVATQIIRTGTLLLLLPGLITRYGRPLKKLEQNAWDLVRTGYDRIISTLTTVREFAITTSELKNKIPSVSNFLTPIFDIAKKRIATV